MTKEKKLKIIKICAIVVWVLLMLFPTIYTETKEVNMLEKKTNYIVETDTYEFEIVCDTEIVSGEIVIGFYDNSHNALKSYTTEFKQDASKVVKILVASNDIPDDVGEYKIEEMYVKSATGKTIELVLYPVSIAYAIMLVALLRITILSYDYKGKKVEVYAGLRNNTLTVDGQVVAEEKKIFSMKPIVLQTTFEDAVVFAQIMPNHKISLYTKAVEEPEVAVEEKQQEPTEVSETEEVSNSETVVEENPVQEETKTEE